MSHQRWATRPAPIQISSVSINNLSLCASLKMVSFVFVFDSDNNGVELDGYRKQFLLHYLEQLLEDTQKSAKGPLSHITVAVIENAISSISTLDQVGNRMSNKDLICLMKSYKILRKNYKFLTFQKMSNYTKFEAV